MRPLSEQDVESELSYAYLHAVASHASMSCHPSNRHQDNAGIDAMITAWGPFGTSSLRNEIDIKVQLKATVETLPTVNGKMSYFFRGAGQYADLITRRVATPRLLVVLCLPRDRIEWLTIGQESLALKRCAFWVSLRDAQPSTNPSGQTIRIPCDQILDAAALRVLAAAVAANEVPSYDAT
jgi:Domain of unknown function (DUF4365)